MGRRGKCTSYGYHKYYLLNEFLDSHLKCAKCGNRIVSRILVRGKSRPRSRLRMRIYEYVYCLFCGSKEIVSINRVKPKGLAIARRAYK